MVETASTVGKPAEGRARKRVVTVAAVAGLAFLTGCSALPDALNPVAWYESATDTAGGWFSDDETSEEAQAGTEQAPADSSFPNLASVPERPVPSTTEEERAQIQQGLVADRDNARYSDQARASAPASAPSATQSTGSTTTLAPPPAPSVAPPPAAAVASAPAPPRAAATQEGQASTLWPRRPAPETRLPRTTSGAVAPDSALRRPSESLDISTDTKRQTAAAQPAPSGSSVRVETPATRSTQLDSTTATPPVPPATPAPQSAAGSASAPTAPSAAGETPSVIVDGPTLDQYQLGFSGPAYLVGTVYFRHGSAGLTGEERKLISQIAGAALQTDAYVRVVGHASSRTAEMPLDRHELVNFNVSLARAETVAAALVAGGVPEGRVLVEAMSASQPLFFESMPSGEAGNRRTEILFQY